MATRSSILAGEGGAWWGTVFGVAKSPKRLSTHTAQQQGRGKNSMFRVIIMIDIY